MKESIIVANASGFWGDEVAAIERQIDGGPIDYLTGDFLAEITMIILARQRARDPQAGYARDFVQALARVLHKVAEKNITVISNAGGINPCACAAAIEEQIAAQGLHLPVAVVDGDDLMGRLPEMIQQGCALTHLDTGAPLASLNEKVISANAYIGARSIVAALEGGVRIVITGRTYDAASVLAPIVHEFGWAWHDFDRLAAALVAGHLIECGAQSTGGNYTLWKEVPSFSNMGYPLVEVHADGSFYLTKHPGSGGLVNVRTAKEQILYEIGDPRAYLCPDVAADFTSLSLTQAGPDRVLVKDVRGRQPPSQLKVSVTYEAGYKAVAMLVVSGPDVIAKAECFAKMFWERVGDGFSEQRTDFVGYTACWGESAAPGVEPSEIILRFAARAADKALLVRMSREIAGLILSGPPGVTVFGGRPQVQPAYGFWPALIPREAVTARLRINGEESFFNCAAGPAGELALPPEPLETGSKQAGETVLVPLGRVAHARSGDKGDCCNIGVAALDERFYPELLRELTCEKVAAFFNTNVRGSVRRYRLDNLGAVNFVLENALDGGGTVSLLLDNQGKTLSQALLTMPVAIDRSLLAQPVLAGTA